MSYHIFILCSVEPLCQAHLRTTLRTKTTLHRLRATVLCAKASNPKFKNSPKTLPITPLYSSLHDATTDLKWKNNWQLPVPTTAVWDLHLLAGNRHQKSWNAFVPVGARPAWLGKKFVRGRDRKKAAEMFQMDTSPPHRTFWRAFESQFHRSPSNYHAKQDHNPNLPLFNLQRVIDDN